MRCDELDRAMSELCKVAEHLVEARSAISSLRRRLDIQESKELKAELAVARKEAEIMNTYTVISVKTDGSYEVVTSITQAKSAYEAQLNCVVEGWLTLGALDGQQVLS